MPDHLTTSSDFAVIALPIGSIVVAFWDHLMGVLIIRILLFYIRVPYFRKLPYNRIPNMNPKMGLLWSIWVMPLLRRYF